MKNVSLKITHYSQQPWPPGSPRDPPTPPEWTASPTRPTTATIVRSTSLVSRSRATTTAASPSTSASRTTCCCRPTEPLSSTSTATAPLPPDRWKTTLRSDSRMARPRRSTMISGGRRVRSGTLSVPKSSLTSSFLHGARVTVDRKELGNTERFNYSLGTFFYPETGEVLSDYAPESGSRPFDLKLLGCSFNSHGPHDPDSDSDADAVGWGCCTGAQPSGECSDHSGSAVRECSDFERWVERLADRRQVRAWSGPACRLEGGADRDEAADNGSRRPPRQGLRRRNQAQARDRPAGHSWPYHLRRQREVSDRYELALQVL